MGAGAAYAQATNPSLAIAFLCNCSFLSHHFRPFHNRICPLSLHPIPSLRPSHLMLPFSPSPLSSSQSKVSDFRPQHSQSYAAVAATTVPRLSPCFCFRMRVEYSNRRLRRRRDGRRCRWEYVRDQGELSHVRYSLAASEVSILPPSLPDSLPGNLQRFKMISKIRSRCMHEMV